MEEASDFHVPKPGCLDVRADHTLLPPENGEAAQAHLTNQKESKPFPKQPLPIAALLPLKH